MNNIVKAVIGVILGIAALVVIFLVLPGNLKNPMVEWFQSTFQKDKYETVEYLKKQMVPGTDDITFEVLVDKAGGSGAWVIDTANVGDDGKTGRYEIHAFVYKVDISMAQENGQENRKSFTQATAEITFFVERKPGTDREFVVTQYNLAIDDVGQNDFYKAEALKSMAGKARNNNK